MKFFVATVFTLLALALASADVSHLSKSYLPPVQQSYTGASYHQPAFPASGSEAPSNQYLPPVQQTISAASYTNPYVPTYASSVPSIQETSYHSSGNVGLSAPSNEYLPPVQQHLPAPAPVHESYHHAPAVAGPSYSGASYGFVAGGAHGISSGASHGFSSGSGSGADIGTQYAANGGYIYKK